ncbi:MAG TPA: hypothetical protein PLB11_11485 [Flavobacterium sp.]|nr:hypothetical protein [Flavobacterium sp.]
MALDNVEYQHPQPVDIILVLALNGVMKNYNSPVQICFRVPKEIDSKVVLDEGGAESLAGAGDGLIRSPEYPELVSFQAYFKP